MRQLLSLDGAMSPGADNPVARSALAEAGRTLDPTVDVDAQLVAFAAAGYELPPDVVAFLATFSGLTLVSARGETLSIDPLGAVARNRRSSIEEYASVAGIDLFPVGEAYDGYMVVMRGVDGSSYVAIDWTLARLGRSDLEAFEVFLTDAPLHYLRQ